MKDAAAIYATEIGATKLAEARTPYLPENIWDFSPKKRKKQTTRIDGNLDVRG